MKHYFAKYTALGTLSSIYKDHTDGSVSVWTELNGNHIYRGTFLSQDHAEAWFIINGYTMTK